MTLSCTPKFVLYLKSQRVIHPTQRHAQAQALDGTRCIFSQRHLSPQYVQILPKP